MKIAFFSENNNFCEPIIEELQKHHELTLFKFAKEINLERMAKLMNWADVLYFEWADHLAQVGSWMRPDKFIVVRLHRYEIWNDIVKEIRWQNVDLLISNVAHNTMINRLMRIIDQSPKEFVVLPDGVDLEFWKFHERDFKPPYRIVMAGNIIPRKGIYEAIRMFADLEDEDFELNIVGKRWPEYYENCREICEELELGDRVKFWEHMDRKELVKFFKKMHLIISNSRDEGNHTVIKEGMATGLYPVVNAWAGARETYPESCIFRTEKEFIKIVKDWKENADKQLESRAARNWVEKRYDARVRAAEVRKAIERAYAELKGKD